MVTPRKVDPVLVAVLDNRFMAITEEIGRTMQRTSRSPIFSEAWDFVTAIFTKDLRLVAQLDYLAVLASALPVAMGNIGKAYEGDINEGDVFIHNDPYSGNNHLPDVNIAKPVFYNHELMFWSVVKGHMADIGGGGVAGYNPSGTTIWDDGLIIPACKLYDRGKPNRGVWEIILKNNKIPEIVEGDLMCEVGAITVGERNLLGLLDQYGPETIYAAIDEIIAATEKETRDNIRQIPDGVYYGERSMDHDGIVRDKPLTVRAKVIKQGDEITIDLSDSDPQAASFVNSSWANTLSACHVAVYFAIPGIVKRNQGSIGPIKVIAPKGTCVNAEFPAAVTMCTVTTAAIIIEAIWLALSNAIPQWITSGHGTEFIPFIRGINPRTKRSYVNLDFLSRLCPASGTEGYDGWALGGNSTDLGRPQTPDIEIYELVYPMRVLQYEQQIDTAGAGKFRGGPGHQYNVQYLDDCMEGVIVGRGLRDFSAPKGLFGGKGPKPTRGIMRRADGTIEELDVYCFLKHKAGDIFESEHMGGPGFGDPFERDPGKVQEDVRNELVSIKGAKEDYGVVIDPVTLEVDAKATEELRKGVR